MVQLLLLTVGALVVGAIGFGVAVLVSGAERGLQPVEPDGRALALPASRPLVESDFARTRFDTAIRGYRMAQVDTALRRAAYDIGYKQELIGVLEAEVAALREGRTDDADALRSARESALRSIADDQAAPGGGEAVDIEPIDFDAVEVDTPTREAADIELGGMEPDDMESGGMESDGMESGDMEPGDMESDDMEPDHVKGADLDGAGDGGDERAHRPEETRLS
jgi:DivIVA domain-containing protein